MNANVTLVGLAFRVWSAYFIVRGLLWAAEWMMDQGGFPPGMGEWLAVVGVGLWSAGLARFPIRSWTSWQWSFFFSGGVVAIARPWQPVFELWWEPFWAECAAVVVAVSMVAVGLRIALWRQHSRDHDADQDAER